MGDYREIRKQRSEDISKETGLPSDELRAYACLNSAQVSMVYNHALVNRDNSPILFNEIEPSEKLLEAMKIILSSARTYICAAGKGFDTDEMGFKRGNDVSSSIPVTDSCHFAKAKSQLYDYAKIINGHGYSLSSGLEK